MKKRLTTILLGGAVLLAQSSQSLAIEIFEDASWLKEQPGNQYFYTSFIPSDERVDAVMDALLSGEWELDLSGTSNSSTLFQARLRAKVKNPTPPKVPSSREWAKWISSGQIKPLRILAEPQELADLFSDMGRKGFTPIYVSSKAPTGEYRYAFIRSAFAK